MSLIWLISVPVALFLIRKYRESKWGLYKEQKILKYKIFLVTGGNSGLGKETVKELASREATVIVACRDLQKAKKVIAEIRSEIRSGELVSRICVQSFLSMLLKCNFIILVSSQIHRCLILKFFN